MLNSKRYIRSCYTNSPPASFHKRMPLVTSSLAFVVKAAARDPQRQRNWRNMKNLGNAGAEAVHAFVTSTKAVPYIFQIASGCRQQLDSIFNVEAFEVLVLRAKFEKNYQIFESYRRFCNTRSRTWQNPPSHLNLLVDRSKILSRPQVRGRQGALSFTLNPVTIASPVPYPP